MSLEWPTDLDVRMVDGRLELTFLRRLSFPIELADNEIQVAFYEATYFFAFSITQTPELFGANESCSQTVTQFSPDEQDGKLQEALAKLGQEEVPDNPTIGAAFADRINVWCELD